MNPDAMFIGGGFAAASVPPELSPPPPLPSATAAGPVEDGLGAAGEAGERRAKTDRRDSGDRRSSLDRRRGPGRRRTDYRRDAEEGCMNEEQMAFILAMDEYKRVNNRPFPTWTEVLDLLLYLGYRKVAEVGEFKLSKGRQTPLRPKAAAAAVPADMPPPS
jgi:hypothetical protein